MSKSEHEPKLVELSFPVPIGRIALRSPKLGDAQNMLDRVRDPECTKFIPHLRSPKQPFTLEKNEKQIINWRAKSLVNDLFLIVVRVPEVDGGAGGSERNRNLAEVIGDGGFGSIDWDNKTCECGVMLNSGPSIRRKGYASETIEIMLAYAFEQLGMERVVLGTATDKMPMRGVLKKLGFVETWREEAGDWLYSAEKEWWAQSPLKKNVDVKGSD